MAFTNAQKLNIMKAFIKQYYWDTLSEAGFVSYKNEGFHWYKMEGDLLCSVRLPVFSPRTPLCLNVGFGIIPLFVWEHIAPTGFWRDAESYFSPSQDHIIEPDGDSHYEACRQLLGGLPRQSYLYPSIAHYTSEGICIEHLNTPRCGAEILQELIFPMFQNITSVQALYEWNKQRRIRLDLEHKRHNSEEIMKTTTFIRNSFSQAISDQCLYFRDKEWYPRVIQYMKAMNNDPALIGIRHKTKELEKEYQEERLHREILIKAIEQEDWDAIDEELQRNEKRMRLQIKNKLPQLGLA